VLALYQSGQALAISLAIAKKLTELPFEEPAEEEPQRE
jgi:hypothetical protein